MAKGKDTTPAPASKARAPIAKADLLDRVALAMRLISLASEQTRQAQLNADLAKVGLAELIVDLEAVGVAS